MKEWFESWFDTHYYHILYKDRDYSEAEFFIKNLFDNLDLEKNKKVLDLACGKGRHAIFINSLGYATTGVDLSVCSIEKACCFSKKDLNFFTHDMREPIENKKFDLVLNLFTSFGYFKNKSDNLKMLKSIYAYMNSGGKLVIDFLNAEAVLKNIVPVETKSIEGIDFNISKKAENGFVVKQIKFEDNNQSHLFEEKVQLLKLNDFESLLEKSNFEIEHVYGNYKLDNYQLNSDRLIIIAKKGQE